MLAGRGRPQSFRPLLRDFGCGASWPCLTSHLRTTSRPGQRHVHRELVRATPLSAASHFLVRQAFKHMALNYFKRESLGAGPRRSCACSAWKLEPGSAGRRNLLRLEASRCQCRGCQLGQVVWPIQSQSRPTFACSFLADASCNRAKRALLQR